MAITTRTGGTIAVTLQELNNPRSGRIDATRVAQFLAVPVARLARALGADAAAVRRTPDALSLQPRLAPLKRALELISRGTVDRRDARAWLEHAHPDLDGYSPLQVMLDGQADAVVTLLQNANAGLPS